MVWEIILALILAIGIGTAFNEARLKRATRKNKAKTVRSKQYPE
jgi:hypothetical protein